MAFFDRLRRLVPGGAPFGPIGPLDRAARAIERGRLDDADAELAAAFASAATAAELAAVRNKRAVVAVRRNDRQGAVDELVAALEADPRCAAAITTTGNLLLEDGDVDEAIAHYEYAILIDDSYAPAYHNLGVALHRGGRRSEAVRMLRKATRLEGRIKRP